MKYVLYYNEIESWDGLCSTTIIKIFDSQEEAERHRDELLKPSLEFDKSRQGFLEECNQKIRRFFESNRKSLLCESLNLSKMPAWASDPEKIKIYTDNIIDKFFQDVSFPISYFSKASWDNKNSYIHTLLDVHNLDTEPLIIDYSLTTPNPYYENGNGYSGSGFGIQGIE